MGFQIGVSLSSIMFVLNSFFFLGVTEHLLENPEHLSAIRALAAVCLDTWKTFAQTTGAKSFSDEFLPQTLWHLFSAQDPPSPHPKAILPLSLLLVLLVMCDSFVDIFKALILKLRHCTELLSEAKVS